MDITDIFLNIRGNYKFVKVSSIRHKINSLLIYHPSQRGILCGTVEIRTDSVKISICALDIDLVKQAEEIKKLIESFVDVSLDIYGGK